MSFISIEEDDNVNTDDNFSICDHIQYQDKLQQKQNQLNFYTNNANINSSLQILQFQTNQDQSILQNLTTFMPKYKLLGLTVSNSPEIKQSEINLLRFFQALTKKLRSSFQLEDIIHITHTLLFHSFRSCLKYYTSKSFAYFLQINQYNIKTKNEDFLNGQCDQAKQIKIDCQEIRQSFSKEAKQLTELLQIQISLYQSQEISTQCLMAILQKLLYNFFVQKSIDTKTFGLVQKFCKISYELIFSFYSDEKFQFEELKRLEQAKYFLSSSTPHQITQLEKIQKQKDEIIISTIQRREGLQYQFMIKHQRQQQQRPKKQSPEIFLFPTQSQIQSSGNISQNCEQGNEFEKEANESQSLNESQNNNTKTQVSQIQQLEKDKKTENQENQEQK